MYFVPFVGLLFALDTRVLIHLRLDVVMGITRLKRSKYIAYNFIVIQICNVAIYKLLNLNLDGIILPYLQPQKLEASVLVPPAPVRVPIQRPLALSVASVASVANDKGDNEINLRAVHLPYS